MTTMNRMTTEDRTQEATNDANRIPRPAARIFVAAFVAAAGALAFAIHGGITTRVAAESSLARSTEDAAIPIVNVIHPKDGAPLEELILPGNTQAFSDTPIFARTSGYLKRWYFDIGAHVKRGDLLAEIETPEIDKQLQQARADLETAQANYHLAETTAARWQFLLQSDSVSRQETDEKVADQSARKATVDSNASNVRRLEDLQSFQKVYAPFDGVLTARNTDVGALIDAGANSAGKETVPSRGDRHAPCVCRDSGSLFPRRAAGRHRVPDPRRISRPFLPGHAGADVKFDRPGVAHASDRSRCSESRWPASAGRIRFCSFQAASDRSLCGGPFEHVALPVGRSARCARARWARATDACQDWPGLWQHRRGYLGTPGERRRGT